MVNIKVIREGSGVYMTSGTPQFAALVQYLGGAVAPEEWAAILRGERLTITVIDGDETIVINGEGPVNG